MNIGIVGAGIVGRLLSMMLLQRGHQVTLFDKTHAFDHTTTSQVAAGMLAPFAELENGDVELFQLAKDAAARWEAILKQLDPRPTFHMNGSLLIANPQETTELTQFIARAERLDIDLNLLSPDEISDIEPGLSDQAFNGIYLEQEGYLDTAEVMAGLADFIKKNGATWHEETKVIAIKNHTVFTNTDQMIFDQVFDCRGMGAKSAFKDLRAVRGELLWVQAPEVNFTRPIRLLHPRYALYIVPRFDNHYIIGATSIDAEDYSPISVQSTLELLTACYAVHPGFSEARVVYTATQCRPAFNNNLPKIMKTPDCIRINGMYRHGFLLGPKIASAAVSHLSKIVKETRDANLVE